MTEDGEFRATSDRMVELLRRLVAIEEAKRAEPFDTRAFLELAREAEDVARVVFRWAGVQREMSESLHAAAVAGRRPPATIEATRARRLDQVLAAWREAQLRLELARPGSPDAARAVDEIESVREEYRAIADTKFPGSDQEHANRAI